MEIVKTATRWYSNILAEETRYSALIIVQRLPELGEGEGIKIPVKVVNISSMTWQVSDKITLGNRWLKDDGAVYRSDDGRAGLPGNLAPGEKADVLLPISAPKEAGNYLIEFDMVHERVCWFAQKGSKTLRIPLEIKNAQAMALKKLQRQVDELLQRPSSEQVSTDRAFQELKEINAQIAALESYVQEQKMRRKNP